MHMSTLYAQLPSGYNHVELVITMNLPTLYSIVAMSWDNRAQVPVLLLIHNV